MLTQTSPGGRGASQTEMTRTPSGNSNPHDPESTDSEPIAAYQTVSGTLLLRESGSDTAWMAADPGTIAEVER